MKKILPCSYKSNFQNLIYLLPMDVTIKFKKIFDTKGIIAPISEKAHRNFKMKFKVDDQNRNKAIHYYGIGHVFKNLNTKSYFNFQVDNSNENVYPTRFLNLQKENFDFAENFERLLASIRDINSHYIHTFDRLSIAELDNLSPKIIPFLLEAFELACIDTMLKEKKLEPDYYYLDQVKGEKELVKFLGNKFYPNDEYQKTEREIFFKLSLNKAIQDILFIQVDEKITWKLFNDYEIFDIKEGKYLSFYASLFLISMFLYKNEAIQLISKIKGFKKTDGEVSQSKRNIFSFFSKKFSSQDVDSENLNLIKFRDIIQYLNHYPVCWNKHLELESSFPEMTNKLINSIIEIEISRIFPDGVKIDKERFILFSKQNLFSKYYPKKKLNLEYANAEYDIDEIELFQDKIINQSPKLKNIYSNLSALEIKLRKQNISEKEKKEILSTKRELESELEIEIKTPNPDVTKLNQKLDNNLFISSYGRNKDRFFDFSLRFLAEINYFGEDAKFQCYQFYTTDEQVKFLIDIKDKIEKKEFEKLKYHQGKLTHFITYKEHLNKYDDWYIPFVKENNAFQIEIILGNSEKKIISIQRSLLIYFLHDALYNPTPNGLNSITNYYFHFLQDFETGLATLKNSENQSVLNNNKIKKIFPRKLFAKINNNQNSVNHNPYLAFLKETKNKELRYENLLTKARKFNREDDFLKKNKGKQFKLNFIKKAWQLMYFKPIYLEKVTINGHHKQYNITKAEFENYCRWMFGFETTPSYKTALENLFHSKGFFNNSDFKELFEKGTSLEDWYKKTKTKFEKWILNQTQNIKNKITDFANYPNLNKNQILYINLSHYLSYLESKGKIIRQENKQIHYPSLSNNIYLIDSYYYSTILIDKEQKKHGKLFNELRKARLEDSILYEIAMVYFSKNQNIVPNIKNNVYNILTETIEFEIKNAKQISLYKFEIPFSKIDSYLELIAHKNDQELEFKGSSFMSRVFEYLQKLNLHSNSLKVENELKEIYKCGSLTYDSLNKFYAYIMNQSLLFTDLNMAIELYFINRDKLKIHNSNRIEYKDILPLTKDNYYTSIIRNRAFHFGIPEKNYRELINEIQKIYFEKEIKNKGLINTSQLTKSHSLLIDKIITIMFNNLYDKNIDTRERIINARNKYLEGQN